jgi:hypothetical protein
MRTWAWMEMRADWTLARREGAERQRIRDEDLKSSYSRIYEDDRAHENVVGFVAEDGFGHKHDLPVQPYRRTGGTTPVGSSSRAWVALIRRVRP